MAPSKRERAVPAFHAPSRRTMVLHENGAAYSLLTPPIPRLAGGTGFDHCELGSKFRGYDRSMRCEEQGAFADLPTLNVKVPQQLNSYDCGVFMLKYIEEVAMRMPDFYKHSRPRWDQHSELAQFRPKDIKGLRQEMATKIRAAGAAAAANANATDADAKPSNAP